jgi:hypothetical protein
MSLEQQFVRQKIPIEIQQGKPIIIEIHSLSGNGVNDVGIRCSAELWKAIIPGARDMKVRLKSSSKPGVEVGGISLGGGATAFLDYIPDFHNLFYVAGPSRSKAQVEITFMCAPAGISKAEILIGQTPADTGL